MSVMPNTPSAPPEAKFISVRDMAVILDVSLPSAYGLLNSGAVESRYIGKSRKVLVSSLEAYIEALPTTREA